MKSNTTNLERLRNYAINQSQSKQLDNAEARSAGKAENEPEVVGDYRPNPAGHSKLDERTGEFEELQKITEKYHIQLKFNYYE